MYVNSVASCFYFIHFNYPVGPDTYEYMQEIYAQDMNVLFFLEV